MLKNFLFKSGLDIVVSGLYEFINQKVKGAGFAAILKLLVRMFHGLAALFLDNNPRDDEQVKDFLISQIGGLPANVAELLLEHTPHDLTEEDAARFRQLSADYDYFIQRLIRKSNA